MNYEAELSVRDQTTHPISKELREKYPDLPEGDSYKVVYGYIYGDTKGRFRDGDWVRTSWVVEETDEFIRTRNTLYKKR